MITKNSVLLLLICFGFSAMAQSEELAALLQNSDSEQDVDQFYLHLPLKEDALAPFDTSQIPAEYSHAILDKKVNCYAYFNKQLKGSALIIRTAYLRNLNGIAYLLNKNISENKTYGITIFKKDGEKIHFTQELKQKEFDKRLKKELRPGDIVRFYYVYSFTQMENSTFFMSEAAPIHHATFIMQAEEKLAYSANGLNGMKSTMDTTIENFQILEFKGENLPIVRDEKYTASNVSMAQVIYNLTYHRHFLEDKLYDFAWASRTFHNFYKKEIPVIEKATAEIYPKIKIEKGDSDDTKAQKIDDYMKENFLVFSFNFNFTIDLKKIFGDKYLAPDDAFKYYVSLLRRAGVETEIALLPNRLNHKLDPNFETWEYFSYIALYLPSTKKYLHPKSEQYRYGQLPTLAKDNEAVYILDHQFGNIQSSKFVLRELEANGYQENKESLQLTIDLSDLKKPAAFSKTYEGDYAESFSNSFKDLRFDDKENIFNNSCKLIDPKGTPTATYNFNDTNKDSFAISGDFYANGLIQNNGSEIAIGKLLGHKEELSSTEKRQAQFAILPQTRNVTVQVTLPTGKKATNLSDFNATYASKTDKNISYLLTATQKDDVVTINLQEIFKKIVYDLEEYTEIKEMFNLANVVYAKKLIIE